MTDLRMWHRCHQQLSLHARHAGRYTLLCTGEQVTLFDDWDDKSASLARAGARHAHHISALQHQRDGLALHGRGQLEALTLDRSQQ